VIEAALADLVPAARVTTPQKEPEVRVVDGRWHVFGDVGTDGRLRITATSHVHHDDWGTSHERHWVIDDPDDVEAARDAVAEAIDAMDY
jgi:hypothetical protein